MQRDDDEGFRNLGIRFLALLLWKSGAGATRPRRKTGTAAARMMLPVHLRLHPTYFPCNMYVWRSTRLRCSPIPIGTSPRLETTQNNQEFCVYENLAVIKLFWRIWVCSNLSLEKGGATKLPVFVSVLTPTQKLFEKSGILLLMKLTVHAHYGTLHGWGRLSCKMFWPRIFFGNLQNHWLQRRIHTNWKLCALKDAISPEYTGECCGGTWKWENETTDRTRLQWSTNWSRGSKVPSASWSSTMPLRV